MLTIGVLGLLKFPCYGTRAAHVDKEKKVSNLWRIALEVARAGPGAIALALVLAIVLGVVTGCAASVGGATLEDADLSLLCGSSSSRLLPECREFSR